MKSIGRVLLTGLGLFALLGILHAQLSFQAVQPIAEVAPDSIVQLTAEAQGLELISPEVLPRSGTFWVVSSNGFTAPYPCLPGDAILPVYAIADGIYLVDDSGGMVNPNLRLSPFQSRATSVESALEILAGSVAGLISQVQDTEFVRGMAMAFGMEEEMESDSPESFSSMFAVADTNALWLEITNVSSSTVFANLHNATNQVYAIWGTTNLLTTWRVEMELWPATNQTSVLPFTLLTLNLADLFLRAEDWTGKDSNSDGIPDWWAWKYFGNFNQSATNDFDGDSVNNGTEYTNNTDPNKISFTVRLGSQNFNTTNATGTFLVLGGVPSYSAVLVNDTNLNNAVWLPYDGNISMNLGATDGVYEVRFGLKGRAADSQITWLGTDMTLNRQTPQITLTSPTNGVVAQPYLQLQGFATSPLAKVTYDLNGQTNQLGFIIKHTLDTNTLTYTTDYFQCYDLLLNEGTNAIALHATDPAGNSFSTNLNVVLDYGAATNPVIKLTWPQNGLELCGSNFTVRGWTEDAASKIAATITTTNGVTNTITGVVERDGKLWAENLPLNDGINFVTLVVTNAAGFSSVTNFTVVKSDMVLELTSIDGDLWLPTVSVSGTISATNATVWVNGVQGTNYGDGTWRVDNVPVTEGGVASFDVNAIPAGEDDPAISKNAIKEDKLVMETAGWTFDYKGYLGPLWDEGWDGTRDKGNFTYTNGGVLKDHFEAWNTNNVSWYAHDTNIFIPAGDSSSIALEQGVMRLVNNHGIDSHWEKTSNVKMMFYTGGRGVAGQDVLIEATGSANEIWPVSTNVPYEEITIAALGKLDTNGLVRGAVPNGTPVDVTPETDRPFYSFTAGAIKYTLVARANSQWLGDITTPSPKFCVGQNITFSPYWIPHAPPYSDATANWTLPGTFVNTNSDPNCVAYYSEDASQLNRVQSRDHTLSTSCWYVKALQAGNAGVAMELVFTNGQKISLNRSGTFDVYRPRVPIFNFPAAGHGTPGVRATNGVLGLIDDEMSFSHIIHSDFPGVAGYTQVIDGEFSIASTGGTSPHLQFGVDSLDNVEFPQGTPPINHNGEPIFVDGPYVGLGTGHLLPIFDNYNDKFIKVNYNTYLLFKPDEGPGPNIFVPLKLVTWKINATATYVTSWTVTGNPPVTDPQSADCTTFPRWQNVFYNSFWGH